MSDERRPTRAIGRRIGLPSGRAVVGALLVALAVVGLFASYQQSQAETGSPYVVVARTVAAGQVIDADDVTIRTLDLGELADRTMTTTDAVVGTVAVQTLLPGRIVQEGDIVASSPSSDGSSTFEVSFALDRTRALDGRLVPGEVVDVLATLDEGGESCTTLVAEKATVVRAGAGAGDVLTNRSSFSVTLAVRAPADVLGVVFAVDEADVTLVRSTSMQDVALAGAYCGNAVVEEATAPDTVAPPPTKTPEPSEPSS